MQDPIVLVGNNRQNIGVGVLRSCFEERKHWNDPYIQNHLPRMLRAERKALFGLCGIPLGRLTGPERHLIRRGRIASACADERGVKLVLKNEDWLSMGKLDARQDHSQSTDSRGSHLRVRPESCPPVGGKDVEHAEGEQIRWNMWMLSLWTRHQNSPFGHAVRNLTKALQNNPTGVNVPLLYDSGVVCVPFQVRPFHWRSGRGANGIPRFSDPRYRDLDGFVLAVHRHLTRDMAEDIKIANKLEARIMDDEKGSIVGDHERRLLQIFPGAGTKLHVFAVEYAAHLKGEEADEFRKRLAKSEYDFAYYVELEHTAFLQTYEDLDGLLTLVEARLYYGDGAEDKVVAMVDEIINLPEAELIPLPVPLRIREETARVQAAG